MRRTGSPRTGCLPAIRRRVTKVLSLAYPWLLLLLPLPWLSRLVLPPRRSPLLAVRVPFGERIESALRAGTTVTRVSRGAWTQLVPALIWLLLLLALARPQWLEPAVSRELPTRDLLLLTCFLSVALRTHSAASPLACAPSWISDNARRKLTRPAALMRVLAATADAGSVWVSWYGYR